MTDGSHHHSGAPKATDNLTVTESSASVKNDATSPQATAPGKRWPDGTNGWGASVIFGIAQALLGAIGLFMSFVITVEKFHLATDPNFVPSCTIDSILQCTSVMESPQASAFGFPNPIIGLVGFPVVITLGVLLAAGVRLSRWIWWGQAIGLLFAVGFVHWLAFNAIYVIIALCPYCMVVWAVTMPLFVMTIVHMVRDRARAKGQYYGGNHFLPVLVVLAWYIAVFLLIWLQFYA